MDAKSNTQPRVAETGGPPACRTFGGAAMIRFRSVLAVLLVAGLSSSRCTAQGMGGMMRGMPAMTLLMMKEVQRELKLHPDQIKRIQERQKELGGTGKGNDLSAVTNAMAITASTDGVEKWVGDILDSEQAKRFHQLILQRTGAMSLVEPSVAKELELTAAQKAQVSTIIDKYDSDQQAAFSNLAQHHGPGDMKAMKKKMEDLKKSTRESLSSILTPAQATKLESMSGPPFKFPKGMDTPF
jgi:Spy/CpxP family protein refolding chaperone